MSWAKSMGTGGCILLAATLLSGPGNALAEPAPLADHHIHIQSAVVTDLLGELKKSCPAPLRDFLTTYSRFDSSDQVETPAVFSGVGQLDLSSLEGIPTEGIEAHTTVEWAGLCGNVAPYLRAEWIGNRAGTD